MTKLSTGPDMSLAAREPKLAREWNKTRNNGLRPRDVLRASRKKVWWKCRKGHEWEAAVYSRTLGGNGCPYCSGRRAGKDNSLAATFPAIAREWNKKRNGALTAGDITRGSKRRVWWRCAKGHEWQAPVHERTSGRGCPFCAHRRISADNNFAKIHPELASQWHKTRNLPLRPTQVFPASAHRVWWKCSKGHEWIATINSRATLGTGCPYCSGRRISRERSLAVTRKALAREWDAARNGRLTPSDVSELSKRVVAWKCPNGHSWRAAVRDRTLRQRRCPVCEKAKSVHQSL